MSILFIRVFFLLLCTLMGYAISQVRPELLNAGQWWTMMGFGFGGLLIAVDELIKGFSLRAFSAATFGLLLGSLLAWLVDRSQIFTYADEKTQWLIRLGLFVGFSYIGMIMAMRSNKEDFTLIIPYVRFRAQNEVENFILLDTSVIIDGRIAAMIEHKFIEGTVIVPRFVLNELHQISDSSDAVKRARGRYGLEILGRIQRNTLCEVKIHESDFPDEKDVDSKLMRLAQKMNAKLLTCDYNLSKVAELQSIPLLRINDLANVLKTVLLPGETISLKIVREGKEKGQGVGYLADGTMVVVNDAGPFINQQVDAQVLNRLQTGAGIIIFAEVRDPGKPVASESLNQSLVRK